MGVNASIIKFINVFPPNIDTSINEFRFNKNDENDDKSLEGLNKYLIKIFK